MACSAELTARWELIQGHRERLVALARRRCVDASDAEDCAHDALLRAAEKSDLDPARAGAWLTTLTQNLAADTYRRLDRETRAYGRRADEVGRSPEEIAADRDEAIWLAWKASSLSTAQRRALSACAAGFDPRETAALTGRHPEGFVVAHQVYIGAPHDTETLKSALQAAKATGMQLRSVFGDRAYGNETADQGFAGLNITDTVIPRVGRADSREHTRSWRRRYRWRAGVEGRISHCKRRFGLRRTRLKGHRGARIWAGAGFFAHNLDKMAALI